MKTVDRILAKLEYCLQNQVYEPVETEAIELKNAPSSHDDWKEIHKTVCAFLNTAGGILIIGVKDDQKSKRYLLGAGYTEALESRIKELTQLFTDKHGQALTVEPYLNLSTSQIKPLLQVQVLVIYIERLPDELKFAFYKGSAYERRLTGDHKIDDAKIQAREELKQEWALARELMPVPNATLQDLEADKLNEFIQLLNREVKIETIKPDIPTAMPFLTRKGFVREQTPTVLGMLVCGRHVEDFLGGRCQADCFVETPLQHSALVAQNKKVLKDNILPLMENSVGFVYKNIQTGINITAGGGSEVEYPEKLIRESINNSLAHRDYAINKYVNINIAPGKHIEIRNPGGFPQSLLLDAPNHPVPLRRIIPNTKPRNPRLADVLKVFEKWEGKGIGMAMLTHECLANKIDLPYYRFHDPNDISLFIPKGRLVDAEIQARFDGFSGFIERQLNGELPTDEQKLVLAYFYKSELANRHYRYTILLTPDNNHFNAILGLEQAGLLVKHELSGLYPVYIVHRVLTMQKFTDELRQLFGGHYDALSNDARQVLDVIYQYNTFGKIKTVSANLVGNFLYYRQHKAVTDVRDYDGFKRKIRKTFNDLEKNELIVRVDQKPKFLLNREIKRTPSVFDSK